MIRALLASALLAVAAARCPDAWWAFFLCFCIHILVFVFFCLVCFCVFWVCVCVLLPFLSFFVCLFLFQVELWRLLLPQLRGGDELVGFPIFVIFCIFVFLNWLFFVIFVFLNWLVLIFLYFCIFALVGFSIYLKTFRLWHFYHEFMLTLSSRLYETHSGLTLTTIALRSVAIWSRSIKIQTWIARILRDSA